MSTFAAVRQIQASAQRRFQDRFTLLDAQHIPEGQQSDTGIGHNGLPRLASGGMTAASVAALRLP
ncbi:MAG: hypothetical protein C0P74_002590 [Gammaproteobacteria bacterium]